MWLGRYGVLGSISYILKNPFSADAGWGVAGGAGVVNSATEVALNSGTTGGTAGGNADSAMPSSRKVYFEMQSVSGAGHSVGHGLHNPGSPSASLHSSWIRFYTPNPDPAAGTNETWYLGSNVDSTAYGEGSTGWNGGGNGEPSRTGWAVDTGTGKVWVTMNGTTWLGGGDPDAGTSPTFTINVANYTIYAESFYISEGSISTSHCRVYYDLTDFSYTPPETFDYNS